MRAVMSRLTRISVAVVAAAGVLLAQPAEAAGPAVIDAVADGSAVVLTGEREISFQGRAGAQLLVDCRTSADKRWMGGLYTPSGTRLPNSDGFSDLSCQGSSRHKVFETLVLPADGEYRFRFFAEVRATFWLTLADTPAVEVRGNRAYAEVKPAVVGGNAAVSFFALAGQHIRVDCLPWVATRAVLYSSDHRKIKATQWSTDQDCAAVDHPDAPPTGTVVDATMPANDTYLLVFDYERDWDRATQIWFTRTN